MTTGKHLLEETLDALMPLTDPYWRELKTKIAQHLDYIGCYESPTRRIERGLVCGDCPFLKECEGDR